MSVAVAADLWVLWAIPRGLVVDGPLPEPDVRARGPGAASGSEREVMRGNRHVRRLIVLVIALAPLGLPAPSLAAQLNLVVNGRGTIVATIAGPTVDESAEVVCASLDLLRECSVYDVPGRVVTLRAEPVVGVGRSSFELWSDDRCPPGPVCQIALDSDRQAVVASFSPQTVVVHMSTAPQPGGVTSIPPGLACPARPDVETVCSGEFPLLTAVDLVAEGTGAQWQSGATPWSEDTCDAVVGATCSVSARSNRDVDLLFPGGFMTGRSPGGFGVQLPDRDRFPFRINSDRCAARGLVASGEI
jgi:hypothetical protein